MRPPEAYRVLLELLDPRPGQKILDVGCGPAHLLHEARDYGLELHGVDLSRVALEMGRELVPEARLRQADATRLPFVDGCFDYVTCIGALERMPDLDAVLQEQKRVAARDAVFCFLVRNADTLRWKLLMEGLSLRNHEAHQGALSLEDWSSWFRSAGFRVDRVLPDQWPLMWSDRIKRWLKRPASFRHERRGVVPLRFAGEFIFLLRRG